MGQLHGDAASTDKHVRHVLLAENGPTIALFARSLLERWGFTVVWVDSEEMALEALAHASFDIAIVDSILPGAVTVALTCVEVGLPVLTLASNGSLLDGAAATVTAPIDAAALHGAILRCLAETNENPPAARGIDIEAVVALWGSVEDPGFLRVARVFVTELRDFLRRAPGLIAAGDRTAVEREAHSIKGAASNIGAGAVSATAMKLEDEVLSGSMKQIHALISGVEAAAGPTIAGLLALIDEGEAQLRP
jgi:two-component system sensor histidine kinase/response regulator